MGFLSRARRPEQVDTRFAPAPHVPFAKQRKYCSMTNLICGTASFASGNALLDTSVNVLRSCMTVKARTGISLEASLGKACLTIRAMTFSTRLV